jgi:hypothetical protein
VTVFSDDFYVPVEDGDLEERLKDWCKENIPEIEELDRKVLELVTEQEVYEEDINGYYYVNVHTLYPGQKNKYSIPFESEFLTLEEFNYEVGFPYLGDDADLEDLRTDFYSFGVVFDKYVNGKTALIKEGYYKLGIDDSSIILILYFTNKVDPEDLF